MKIAEIETALKQGDCSAEMKEAFQIALKRVPQIGRCQHCYTTAAAMPLHCWQQAISLIQYGLSEHCSCWIDRMRSFDHMAAIYEAAGNYQAAQIHYFQALLSIGDHQQAVYAPGFAAHLMRIEMHISGFEYTENLEQFYEIAILADEFDPSFQKNLFYYSLAEIIIFSKNGDLEAAKESYCSACKMLDPDDAGPLTAQLGRKEYLDPACITKEAAAFLQRARELFVALHPDPSSCP